MNQGKSEELFKEEFQSERDFQRQQEVEIWLNSSKEERFIYGKNVWSHGIAQRYEILGEFLDRRNIGQLNARLCDLNALSTVMGVLPRSALNRAKAISRSAVDAFSFFHLTNNYDLAPDFLVGMDVEISSRAKWYQELSDRFLDDCSKNTFLSLIRFRLYWDLNYLNGFSDLRHFQYLEDFLRLTSNEVLYDVGAYTGDSYKSLTDFFGSFKKSILFEPNKQNFKSALGELGNDPTVSILNLGLGDKEEELLLTSDGSSSKLTPRGGEVFTSVTLDQLDLQPPTFIKVDIEGMEEQFLLGAANTISNYRPKLAIAVYHNALQLRRVIEILDHVSPNYGFYLRHYTEGFTETILYAVPIENAKH